MGICFDKLLTKSRGQLHWRKRNQEKICPMNRLLLAILISTSSLVVAGPSWGQAVSVDAGSLIKRLDAIESRLSTAESRRGAASSAAANIGGASSYSVNDIEQRLGDLETDSSQLRGGNDRATQAIERLAKRLDDFTKDIDMRLSDIEAQLDAAGKTSTAAATAPAETAAVAEPEPTAAPAAGTPVATPPAVKPAAGVAADLSASDHYNKAYAYLTATDYKNAQVWFEEFLKRHPQDALADNAYYWLGEVYLVQNNPNSAVVKFRDGLKAFPKGSKVTANLFKMGVALEQLKQPKLAKAAWEKLLKDYPTAPEAARAKDKLVLLKQAGV